MLINSKFYSIISILFISLLPIALISKYFSTLIYIILMILNILLIVFVFYFCSSENINYWDGLNIISSSLMSGCANITFLYCIPTLIIIYYVMLVISLIGLIKGRTYAQNYWINTVNWFYSKRVKED